VTAVATAARRRLLLPRHTRARERVRRATGPPAPPAVLIRRHLLLGGVHLDVHIVAQLVCAQVGGEGDEALLPEATLEQVACAVAQTLATRHLV
jgi:hypothetical protein